MAETTIEWADFTFNPVIGCQKVSPGCDHCYAEAQNAHRKWNGGEWGPHAPRKRTSENYWRQPLKWDRQAGASERRPRVFCASLADVFDNQWADGIRDDLFDLIDRTQNLDWLLLTKRPENISKMLPHDWGSGYINVWLGTTCEDQPHYERRYGILSDIPTVCRFISYEPALGPLRLNIKPGERCPDWVIAGGESGPRARPMHPDWARCLRDECEAAGIPFLFKQHGEYVADRLFGEITTPDGMRYSRVGKKKAGRLLDGRTHDGFPQ